MRPILKCSLIKTRGKTEQDGQTVDGCGDGVGTHTFSVSCLRASGPDSYTQSLTRWSCGEPVLGKPRGLREAGQRRGGAERSRDLSWRSVNTTPHCPSSHEARWPFGTHLPPAALDARGGGWWSVSRAGPSVPRDSGRGPRGHLAGWWANGYIRPMARTWGAAIRLCQEYPTTSVSSFETSMKSR